MAEEAERLTSPRISIIVPVYKVEQYLRRCLDSIAAQTFTDWECILIDDGSPDASGAICDEYAGRDRRFRVIHQENKGVSAARNAGLDAARGEWIGFVDSDDWIEKGMYEHLYTNAVNSDCDVVICGFVGKGSERRVIQNRVAAKANLFAINGFGGYSFLRLTRRKNVVDIRFDENVSYLEDTKFFYDVFSASDKILWTDAPLYNYFKNPASVSHQIGLTEQAKTAISCLEGIYASEEDAKIKQMIKAMRLNFLFYRVMQYAVAKQTGREEYRYIQKELRHNLAFILATPFLPLKRKIIIVVFALFSDKFAEKSKIIQNHFSDRVL